MPTCRDIITRAFRKAKIIASGEQPESDELDDGMDELQSMYESWGANGMFGRLTDTLQSTDYDAQPGERVIISGGTATLPDSLDDDDETAIQGLSFIEVVDTDAETVTRYLYENGAWVEIGGLSIDDEAPLATRGAMGLSACLAMLLAEEFGGQAGPSTARQAAAFRTSLALNHGSARDATPSSYF